MEKLKSYIPVFISLVISLIIIVFIGINNSNSDSYITKEVYNVYLDGKLIGSIKSKKSLENYINKEQSNLKKEYGVKKIYVPNGIDIEKCLTHNPKIVSEKKIYKKIKEKKGFTIKGYVVTITDSKGKELKINTLKKNLFDKSVNKVIKNFVDSKSLEDYKNNSQKEIETTGSIIEKIYIGQSVAIKESFISTDEQIFSDEESLTKYLLFGSSSTEKEYTVKAGDTIESVAFNNKLNEEEFLIVNPEFTSSKNLLSIGQKVNIALINPILKMVVEKHIVEDMEKPYETIEKEDSNLAAGTTKVETEGVKGVQRVTEKIQYTNGEITKSVIVKADVTKEPVNKVVLKGTKKSYYGNYGNYGNVGTGTYIDTGGQWGWPTASPYIIESRFKWRWGRLHAGIDICVGKNSPIYASRAGTVTSVNKSCANVGSYGSRCGGGYGNYVIIDHGDGTQSIYGHMLNNITVSPGQRVSRGQVLGGMGSSGSSQATHLHFGIYYGAPMRGGKPVDPLTLF